MATSEPPHPSAYVGRPSRLPWPPVLLAAAVIVALALSRIHPLPWPGVDDLAARSVGVAIGACGILLAAWSIVILNRANTTVLPHKAADHLVTSGPYSRFRNPIYLADVLILLGAAELTKNLWFVAVAPIFVLLVTWLAILPEERHLEARFGDAYRDYKSRSRRWL